MMYLNKIFNLCAVEFDKHISVQINPKNVFKLPMHPCDLLALEICNCLVPQWWVSSVRCP